MTESEFGQEKENSEEMDELEEQIATQSQEVETITLEFPLDERNKITLEQMKAGGEADIEQILAQNLQPQLEDLIHQLYKQSKYQQ